MDNVAVLFVPFFLSPQHRLWAEDTLASLKDREKFDLIAIVNNLRRDTDDMAWLERSFNYIEINDKNILSRAWNKGVKTAFARGNRYVVLANLDLIFHSRCIYELLQCAQEYPDKLIWSATRWSRKQSLETAKLTRKVDKHIYWSCFMVDHRLFELVGEFDEQFAPAYKEDCDMRYRLHLKGFEGVSYHAALFYHLESGSLKGCLDLETGEKGGNIEFVNAIYSGVKVNDERYRKKWGGDPGNEKYTEPYGGK